MFKAISGNRVFRTGDIIKSKKDNKKYTISYLLDQNRSRSFESIAAKISIIEASDGARLEKFELSDIAV